MCYNYRAWCAIALVYLHLVIRGKNSKSRPGPPCALPGDRVIFAFCYYMVTWYETRRGKYRCPSNSAIFSFTLGLPGWAGWATCKLTCGGEVKGERKSGGHKLVTLLGRLTQWHRGHALEGSLLGQLYRVKCSVAIGLSGADHFRVTRLNRSSKKWTPADPRNNLSRVLCRAYSLVVGIRCAISPELAYYRFSGLWVHVGRIYKWGYRYKVSVYTYTQRALGVVIPCYFRIVWRTQSANSLVLILTCSTYKCSG